MAISNYAELKTAVANWLHRSDLTSVIPDFIALAESNIRRDVRCLAMEQNMAGTLSAAELALPTRFLEALSVKVDDSVLKYVAPQVFARQVDWDAGNFTIVGDEFRFQTSSGDYSIDYLQSFEPMDADGDTNWLLTNAPEIYLHGALMEAAQYVMGDPSVPAARYRRAILDLNMQERKAKFAGPLTIRSTGMIV